MSATQQAQHGVAVRPVTVPQLLGLLGSLAQLVGRGHEAWRLDVVWTGDRAPWYVDLCRQRSASLGLDDRVDFRAAEELATSGALPEVDDRDQRLVLLLEPMADRRSASDDVAAGPWDDRAVAAEAVRPRLARTRAGIDDPAVPVETVARRRAAAAYQEVSAPADPYRRALVDAVA